MITDDPNNRLKYSSPKSSEPYGSHPIDEPDPVEPWRFQKHANPHPSWTFVVALVAGFVIALALGWWLS